MQRKLTGCKLPAGAPGDLITAALVGGHGAGIGTPCGVVRPACRRRGARRPIPIQRAVADIRLRCQYAPRGLVEELVRRILIVRRIQSRGKLRRTVAASIARLHLRDHHDRQHRQRHHHHTPPNRHTAPLTKLHSHTQSGHPQIT
jgi:hypothetical protein